MHQPHHIYLTVMSQEVIYLIVMSQEVALVEGSQARVRYLKEL